MRKHGSDSLPERHEHAWSSFTKRLPGIRILSRKRPICRRHRMQQRTPHEHARQSPPYGTHPAAPFTPRRQAPDSEPVRRSARHALFPSPLDEAASDALLEKILAHQTRYGFSLWAVEERSTAIFMGFTGLLHVSFSAPFTPCVEIGWRFLPEFQGLGLACEAARSALHHGFHRLNLPGKSSPLPPWPILPSQRLMATARHES